MLLDFEEVHRMKWCTILNKKEDMAIREQLMQFQINVSWIPYSLKCACGLKVSVSLRLIESTNE